MYDMITEIFCAVSRLKIKRTKEMPLNFGYLSIRHRFSACAIGAQHQADNLAKLRFELRIPCKI